jgi:hypothetical protein
VRTHNNCFFECPCIAYEQQLGFFCNAPIIVVAQFPRERNICAASNHTYSKSTPAPLPSLPTGAAPRPTGLPPCSTPAGTQSTCSLTHLQHEHTSPSPFSPYQSGPTSYRTASLLNSCRYTEHLLTTTPTTRAHQPLSLPSLLERPHVVQGHFPVADPAAALPAHAPALRSAPGQASRLARDVGGAVLQRQCALAQHGLGA